MPEYITVGWVNPNSLPHAQWSEKKDRIVKTLVEARALNAENALTGKELLQALGELGGNYSNLRKTLANTVGIVTVVPTIYKSTLANRFYADQRVIEVAHRKNPNRFHPEQFDANAMDKCREEKWPSVVLQVPHGMAEDQARKAYSQSYGVTIMPPGATPRGLAKAPMPEWFEKWLKYSKDAFEKQEIKYTSITLALWSLKDEHYMNLDQVREHVIKQLQNKNIPISQVLFELIALNDLNYRTAQKLENK